MSDPLSTTATVLTPIGRGAVAVVAIEGPQAIELLELFFYPAAGSLPERNPNNIVYGRWGSVAAGVDQRGAAEDVIVYCRGKNSIEIHCHGGSAASARIVDDLSSAGAIPQTWQQWMAGRESNSIRTWACSALAQVTTERAAKILLDQYHGALERELRSIASSLNEKTAAATPDGLRKRSDAHGLHDFTFADHALEQLLNRAQVGLHLVRPWRVVVAGPPNVGKSSLINALVGFQRSIVFDQPGTTRDIVTVAAALDGWPVEFVDTAGLRDSSEPLEAAGAEKARSEAAAADCLLLVFDVSQSLCDEITRLAAQWPAAMIVGNKCDLISMHYESSIAASVFISARTGEGIDELICAIVARLVPIELQPGDAVTFTDEQVAGLQAALTQVRSGDAHGATQTLLSLLA